MTKQIQLPKGMFALVDDEDFEYLNQWKWGINHWGYPISGENNTTMHRRLLEKKDGLEIDHINRDKLDNRKSNLRYVTPAYNKHNVGKKKNNTSGYKGVYLSYGGKYRASIGFGGKTHHSKYFIDIVQAAKAYDEMARKFYGDFADTNF